MMRKQNKNKFFRLSALLVLILALSFTLIACAPENPGDGDESETPVTETVLDVKNGNFEYVTGTEYPKAPKNWTFTTGYTLSSTDSVHVYNGVIKVTEDAYSLYSEKYHTSANPGQVGTDDYVLMINNAEYYSASYTSDTITFAKGKYYALTVSVKTKLAENNESGAFIMLENDGNTRTYLSFDKIQDSDWTTYTFWIEASKSASNTAKLVLTNGDGGKTSGDLSKGEVFFDSAILTEKTQKDYEDATKDNDSKTECYTFALRNANFTETSSETVSDKPVTPYDWTSYVGRDDNGSNIAPTVGLSRGVIDTKTYVPSVGILAEKDGDDFKYPITNSTTDQNADSNVLMIYLSNQTSPSAYSYYSNSITFEYDKIYKLTFDVRTVGLKGIDQDKNIVDTTNGVTVKLGEDKVLFENIQTENSDWETYTTYVYGSATQSKNFGLYFWLGQGHAEDKDGFVSGAAFFDNITLTEITKEQLTEDKKAEDALVDFRTNNILVDQSLFGKVIDATNWTWEYDTEKHGDEPKGGIYALDLDDYDTVKDSLKLNATNPGKATVNRDNNDKAIVFVNQTANATWSSLKSENVEFTINKNLSYRLSFWVKTSGIKSGSGATIALMNTSDEEDVQVSSLTSINTETFDEDGNVDGNEWTEVVFYVQGNQIEDKTVSLKISLGSGNMYNPSYLSGEVFMSNFYLEKVDYKDYNSSSTSNTVAKYSFRSTESAKITNGNFNNVDIDKSENAISTNGTLVAPAVVQNWTASKETGAQAGVITKTVFDTVKSSFTAETFNNPFFDDENSPNKYNGAPNILMIYSGTADNFSYTSPSMSLNAKTYYKVSINANVKEGSVKIEMINGDKVVHFDAQTINGSTDTENLGWRTYTFYVKVGLNSSNLKLRLSVNSAETVAFFDNATYEDIGKDAYDELEIEDEDYAQKVNLNLESFVNDSDVYPATPTNYNGAVIGKAPSTDDDFASGVLNVNHFDLDVQEKFDLTTIDTVTGDNVLVIYNKQDTAYGYTSNTYSFSADSYYKITVHAKTQSLGEGDKAKIKLSLSNLANAEFAIDGTEWKDYTFYVKTDDTALSSVTLSLSLGEYNLDDDDNVISGDLAKGYVFFDDISIDDITEDDYTTGIANITETTTNIKKLDVVAINIENETTEEDTEADGELSGAEGLGVVEIITIISASLLSIALIAVLVIVFVKKISPKMKEKKNKKYRKPNYDKRTSEAASKDKLDKFKD